MSVLICRKNTIAREGLIRLYDNRRRIKSILKVIFLSVIYCITQFLEFCNGRLNFHGENFIIRKEKKVCGKKPKSFMEREFWDNEQQGANLSL